MTDISGTFETSFRRVLLSAENGELTAIEYQTQLESARSVYEKSLILCPSLGHLEPARLFACIELALLQSDITTDRACNVRLSCLSATEYSAGIQQIAAGLSLNVSQAISIKVLGIITGYDQLVAPCEKLFSIYVERFSPVLSEASRTFLTTDNKELVFAVFFSVTSCLKVRYHVFISQLKIDRKSILQRYLISEKNFLNYVQSIRHHCQKELDAIQADSLLFKEIKRQRRNLDKTRTSKEIHFDQAEHVSVGTIPIRRSSIPLLPEHIKYAGNLTDHPEYSTYKCWKETILSKLSQ